MPEIEAIKTKSFDETTMAEAIVLYLANLDDEKGRKNALDRITYLKEKESKKTTKTMHLGLVKE